MPGDVRVGPYRILRLINRGGQGSVYLGYDKRLRRRVAIKIYPLPVERRARKSLLHEAQLVASMQSLKVVQIHDVIESSDHIALVMEYVPGCDLEELLGSVRLSLASILTIAADIAGALTVARQQHIVHGDLKAANILIATNGRAKLTDFGIARRPAGYSGLGGSPSAMSPEQYLGKPLDQRSDLFALGCLLYRMLGGVQPFCSEGQLDSGALLERTPAPLAELVSPEIELPEELVSLVDALLQKDPADRPANTRVVRQKLRRVARGMPLAAGNSLLNEAQPCFRAESAEDLPPAVPADLVRQGRSRLTGSQREGRGHMFAARGWGWPALVTSIAAAVGIVYLLGQTPAQTQVHIEAPVIRLANDTALPGDVSSLWLVTEVTQAMEAQLGSLSVTGPVGATPVTTLYADPALRDPQEPAAEQVQLGLRCADLICVFVITRSWQDQQVNRQAILFPDMTTRQWRDIVRSTTRSLFP